MTPPLDWERDGPTWPDRSASRRVEAGGLLWRVVDRGRGPTILLVHGTASSAHSWARTTEALSRDFRVVAPDLPGHGFSASASPAGFRLPAMARALATLVETLDAPPLVAAGHSAGAAVLARMALDGMLPARTIVSFNGAFLPFGGVAGQVFAPAARALAASPFVAGLIARRGADPGAVRRLLAGTGSVLDEAATAPYRRLLGDPRHVAGALAMMAHWDLAGLVAEMARLDRRLVLVAGDRDRSIPPGQARVVARVVPGAEIIVQKGLGHLAHEERPDEAVRIIVAEAARVTGSNS